MRRRSAPPPSGQQMIREYLGRVSDAATKVLPKGDRLLFVGRTRAAIEAQGRAPRLGRRRCRAERADQPWATRRNSPSGNASACTAPGGGEPPPRRPRSGNPPRSPAGGCWVQAGRSDPSRGLPRRLRARPGSPQGRRRPLAAPRADRPGRAAARGNDVTADVGASRVRRSQPGRCRRPAGTPASAVPHRADPPETASSPAERVLGPRGGVCARRGVTRRPRCPREACPGRGCRRNRRSRKGGPRSQHPRNRPPHRGTGSCGQAPTGNAAAAGRARPRTWPVWSRTHAGRAHQGPAHESRTPRAGRTAAGDTGGGPGPEAWIRRAGAQRRRRRAGCARGGRRLRPARPRRCRSCPA